MTNEEKLELAKKCGAVFGIKHILDIPKEGVFFSGQDEFFAYTYAIEGKHQAQIVMLRDALKEVTDIAIGCTESCPCKQRKAIAATQETADAFVAENKMWILEKAAAICSEEFDYRLAEVARALTKMAAELRNQAQAEGKEGGE